MNLRDIYIRDISISRPREGTGEIRFSFCDSYAWNNYLSINLGNNSHCTDYSAEFKGLIFSFRHPVPARVEDGLEPAAKGGGQRLRDDPAARPPRPLGLLHKGMEDGYADEDD